MATPLSVTELVRRHHSKRGLAVIITNDYSSSALETLAGPEKDGLRMKDVFEKLKIVPFWKHNVSKRELTDLLSEVARLERPATYESLSFVFSGHGRKDSQICFQYGGTLRIQEVIDSLLPQRAINWGNTPKLFFFDACRGSQGMQPVMVPRSASKQPNGAITDRGTTDLKTVLVPPQGNILVAYSNIHNHRALEGRDGGIWMNALANQLVESKESIETVLTEVRQQLQQTYQDTAWREHMQLPETVSRLLQPVYLNPQSQVPLRAPPQNGAAPPGALIERGHYKVKFQNLEQRKVVQDVKYEETYTVDSGFFCRITFVECSNSRRHQVQGESMPNKADAKESAARRAVERLGAGSDGGNSPQSKKSSASVPLPTTSRGKDAISQLKEYCEQHKHREPKYECVASGKKDLPHQQRVIVSWGSFLGKPQSTVKDAKKSAAQKALNTL